MVVDLVPQFVPSFFQSLYTPALYGGLIVAFISLIGIAMQKKDIHILILTDLVGLAMLIVVAAVGTDLAEALVLPGLVVELAEIMAISEILISREMRKIGSEKSFVPSSFSLDMEILYTAPNFIALILIAYGAFLSGFTGGAVAGGGIIIYALSRTARGLPVVVVDGISGISGIAWCLWIIGFVFFFVAPQYWLLSLFLAAFGLFLKVASKMGLIGILMREEFGRK
ncbi:MAG: EhaG family protein [archaeon]|nr:EhaG family protein [archaeon]